MSLATLNKKSKTLYHSMSVNRPQFSLNGTQRNDRSLPSTNRTQTSIPRTLARGNQLRGYGGLNGTFIIKNITVLCEQPNAEQIPNKLIKKSTKNTIGLISTKYLWTKLPNPYTWVKRQNTPLNTSSQLFTENLAKQTIKTASVSICLPNPTPEVPLNCRTNTTKETNTTFSTSQSDFILKLNKNCGDNIVNTVYNLPTNLVGIPILGSS